MGFSGVILTCTVTLRLLDEHPGFRTTNVVTMELASPPAGDAAGMTRLVSFHDSLAYFEKCYGLEIRGVLTQKAGQEPDDKQMKALITRAGPGTTSVTYVSITTISAPIPTPAKNRSAINHSAFGANAPANVNTE